MSIFRPILSYTFARDIFSRRVLPWSPTENAESSLMELPKVHSLTSPWFPPHAYSPSWALPEWSSAGCRVEALTSAVTMGIRCPERAVGSTEREQGRCCCELTSHQLQGRSIPGVCNMAPSVSQIIAHHLNHSMGH